MNEFNLSTVPSDIYGRIDRALERYYVDSAEESTIPLRVLNGLSYFQLFSPWFADWKASEAQLFKHMTDKLIPFFGLRSLAQAYKKQASMPAIAQLYSQYEYEQYFKLFSPVINDLRDYKPNWENDSVIQLILSEPVAEAGWSEYNQSNLSQYHKEKQNQLVGYAYDFYEQAHSLLRKFCLRDGWGLQIRPMYTMQSSRIKDVHSQMMKGGVSNVRLYYSAAQEMVQERLERNHINILGTDSYWDWFFRGSYVMMYDEDSDIEIHFAPWNIPPTFLSRPSDSAPYFFAPPRGTFHVGHALHFTKRFHPTGRVEIAHFKDPRNHLIRAAQLMPVLAACLTLISVTTTTKQGYHKPMWTQAPFNLAMCRIFVHACVKAISEAREIL